MNRKQAEARIAKLQTAIRHHDYLYYVEDRPEVSDEEYDKQYREARRPRGAVPRSRQRGLPHPARGRQAARQLPHRRARRFPAVAGVRPGRGRPAPLRRAVTQGLGTGTSRSNTCSSRSSTASPSSSSTRTASCCKPPPAATAARARGSPPMSAPSPVSPCACARVGIPSRNSLPCAARSSCSRRLSTSSTSG